MNIEKLMISLDIDEDELKSHAEAHNVFSTTGSETKLKQIHPDARDKIGKFYRILREAGIYYYPGKRTQETCSYVGCWQRMINGNPRSMGEKISLSQTKELIASSVKEVLATVMGGMKCKD